MSSRQRVAPLGVALLLLGCVAADQPPEATSDAPTLEADLTAIATVRQREIAAAHASDVEAFTALLTDDAVFMPPNQAMVAGQAALQPWFAAFWEAFSIEGLEYPSSDVTVIGDWAIERFSYEWNLVPVGGGEATHEQGKGVHVYRRQPDGSWKIAVDIWNTDGAPSNGPVEVGR